MAGYSTPGWTNGSAPAIDASALTAMGQAIELAQHPYGVCSTAAATAAKTVTVDFSGTLSLFTGLTVRVYFTYANSVANPTLNVNGTGAIAIKSFGTTGAASGEWAAGEIVDFVYNGTYWVIADGGTQPLVRGGTGGTSAAAGLYNLINGSTALTSSTLAADDFLGLLDTSASTGGKITIANLLTYISNSGSLAKIQTGSYVGTGTYGSANPCSLTFDFEPKIVIIHSTGVTTNVPSLSTLTNTSTPLFYPGVLVWGITTSVRRDAYASISWVCSYADNTVTWYATGTGAGASDQFNSSGTTYYMTAIG